ncbi:fumarylacetoacetate hydrolase family protein [Paracoccus pacificus]|uniref:Fumarylacetoacetate hydrolase family protein n=1 Tax=Paracoccus pacificus TaxID=1463598 RepID=A0ABW4R4M1_9RHOB
MRFVSFAENNQAGLGVETEDGRVFGLNANDSGYPGDLLTLIQNGPDALTDAARILRNGREIDMRRARWLPPLAQPGKIICVGLNYVDHTSESGFQQPDYPTLFARFSTSLIGHMDAMIRPRVSHQLDYEGEIAAVIGRGGRHIPKDSALDHVAGYSIFNDGSVRDYQTKAPQWTVGKNFDGTGAFGPAFVTADALPPGCRGLRLQTRLNGAVMQDASADDMVFDVATLIAIISEAITLVPGDVIVTGTPAGIGLARKPPLFMKPGDICEIEVEGLGTLRNHIADEEPAGTAAQETRIPAMN